MDKFIIPVTVDEMNVWLKDNWPDGIEFNGVYSLSKLPSLCPWQFEPNSAIDQIIDSVFQPITEYLPKTIRILRERCQNIFALLYQNEWYLLYVLKMILRNDKLGVKIVGGGSPTTTPQLRTEVSEAGWVVPNELKLFYQVHNGFGQFNLPWEVSVWDTILPDRMLRVLGEILNTGDVVGYIPKDLLEFFTDGAGNAQCFYRGGSDNSGLSTVDWDHETREMSNPERFWDFVDRQLSQVDEPKYGSSGQLIE